jgi:hypothetical protein
MGGWGSGRRRDAKPTVEDCPALNITGLHRDGTLRSGEYFATAWRPGGERVIEVLGWRDGDAVVIRCRVRVAGDREDEMVERVGLAWTRCHYGGQRPWFGCPHVVEGRSCARRAAILYWVANSFRCRICAGLAYPSQREGREDRAMRRAHVLRRRLGADPRFGTSLPDKPRGMYWRTFARLREQIDVGEEAFYAKCRCLLARRNG